MLLEHHVIQVALTDFGGLSSDQRGNTIFRAKIIGSLFRFLVAVKHGFGQNIDDPRYSHLSTGTRHRLRFRIYNSPNLPLYASARYLMFHDCVSLPGT
jgi:hypothetical protein